jgi:tRNA/rRNA methyltransferase
VALIFGREDRGLTTIELNYAQRFIQIPTHPAYTSLNLAQAVAICCYELSQSLPAVGSPAVASPDLAPLDALERYYQSLEAFLLKIGYLYPHTAPSRMKKLRRLLNRAYPSAAEIALLQGMVSQAEWALQHTRQPPE